MNFLAHLHLSGSDDQVLTGNFIGDSVTSRMMGRYPPGIQKGVGMHRFIDTFTDTHPLIREMKNIMKPVASSYAPVVTDIVCDHYLARDWDQYGTDELESFAEDAARRLKVFFDIFPLKSQQFFLFMTKYQMLQHYGSNEGLHFALSGMSRRASFENRMQECSRVVAVHDAELENLFRQYYPLLQKAVSDQFPTS